MTAALLPLSEVLTRLKVSRSTFDTWRVLGKSPECIKFANRRLYVSPAALTSWFGAPVTEPLLTLPEVLTMLDVARSTFDTWRSLDSAPSCFKLPNGQIRVRSADLAAWLNAHVEMREAA
ncbi:helix-turn-helix transcriptional regulator [Actinomadura rupiterrae]|uniref:helix-turn-helix transcriptional regulator n=1 Tax=Actinomadura rupiterrae TaxID=559627 RepID=UPI0020A5E396|nr:hypothetical protein [Actinomadura rupiterrae]MCP2343394.1 putative DNA-binding transcriptional regulator AlpA [Actinomadura rupiterrae]